MIRLLISIALWLSIVVGFVVVWAALDELIDWCSEWFD